jgi:hypothetical protein
VRQAGIAAPQLGAALGAFALVRTTLEEARGGRGSQWLPAVVAGGAAVALVNTAVPSRRAWMVRYLTAALGATAPVPTGLVVAQSAVSGAVVLGGADRLLDAVLGVRIGGGGSSSGDGVGG